MARKASCISGCNDPYSSGVYAAWPEPELSLFCTNGNVTTTAPPGYSGDGPAVLQAMLSHLLALAG